MTRPKHNEDPFPVMKMVTELMKHEDCPDPEARITGNRKERRLRPGRSYHKVTELRCGTSDAVIGVKVIHRRPTGLQEVHVHTSKPAEVLKYLAVALIG